MAMYVVKVFVLSISITIGLISSTGIALAAPPPEQPTPTQCLDAFTNDPNYVGDGWVAARVARPPRYSLQLSDNPERDYSLFCGNELTGVVHIAHPEGTGSFHPISANENDQFLRCWANVILMGDPAPEASSKGERTIFTYRYAIIFPEGANGPLRDVGMATATAIVDTNRKFTYTLFTSRDGLGGKGNDWLNCGALIAS